MESSGPDAATLTADDAQWVEQVADLLRASRSVLVITGAGLSADSGLPTYRGVGGLYDGRDPDEGLPIETLMSAEVMQARPALTWKYLLQIEKACRGASPNRGHEVIAALESRFDRVWVLTQNVDGFHRRAGSRNVIDIHGDLHRLRCIHCPHAGTVPDYSGLAIPPRCPACGGVLRPDVVLFGERLPARQLATYREETARGFDLVMSVGTTSVFPYIAAPVLDAYHLRRPSVEINPGETDVSEFATVKLPLQASVALGAIWEAYNRQPRSDAAEPSAEPAGPAGRLSNGSSPLSRPSG
jgi:NAD-dependent deacetylase